MSLFNITTPEDYSPAHKGVKFTAQTNRHREDETLMVIGSQQDVGGKVKFILTDDVPYNLYAGDIVYISGQEYPGWHRLTADAADDFLQTDTDFVSGAVVFGYTVKRDNRNYRVEAQVFYNTNFVAKKYGFPYGGASASTVDIDVTSLSTSYYEPEYPIDRPDEFTLSSSPTDLQVPHSVGIIKVILKEFFEDENGIMQDKGGAVATVDKTIVNASVNIVDDYLCTAGTSVTRGAPLSVFDNNSIIVDKDIGAQISWITAASLNRSVRVIIYKNRADGTGESFASTLKVSGFLWRFNFNSDSLPAGFFGNAITGYFVDFEIFLVDDLGRELSSHIFLTLRTICDDAVHVRWLNEMAGYDTFIFDTNEEEASAKRTYFNTLDGQGTYNATPSQIITAQSGWLSNEYRKALVSLINSKHVQIWNNNLPSDAKAAQGGWETVNIVDSKNNIQSRNMDIVKIKFKRQEALLNS